MHRPLRFYERQALKLLAAEGSGVEFLDLGWDKGDLDHFLMYTSGQALGHT